MKNETTIEPRLNTEIKTVVIEMPAGLLGFEDTKRYALISDPEEAPFFWFQMLDEPKKSFILIQPHIVIEKYEPELSDEDVRFLGLNSPEDAVIFNIVTVREGRTPTVNLKGPIVINKNTLVGKQVVPLNAYEYMVNYPLI